MSLIYYFIFSLLVITSYFEFFYDKKSSAIWYYSVVALMILTAGLGYALSPDWVPYVRMYKSIDFVEWNEIADIAEFHGMEQGYVMLNKLFVESGFGFGFFNIVFVTVSLLLKSTTFYKYGCYPFLVLFIYSMPNYLFEEHVHIRQGFATSVAIFSVRYIIEKNIWKFLLCLSIGYQIHESIVVFLLAYWIANFKFNEITIGWLVTIAIIGNYTGLNGIIEVIMKFMPIGQDKFESYQSQLYTQSDVAVGDIVKILSVIFILIYNKYASHDRLYCIFRNFFMMGVLLYFFLGKGIFGIRLPGFYLVFLGLTLGRMLYSFNGELFKRKFIYLSFVSYTIILIFWFQIKQGHKSNFANYRTFFTEGSVYGLWKN